MTFLFQFGRYRERLNKKYESSKPPLIASSWTFLKDGMDDFRDGKVPVVDCSSMIIKVSMQHKRCVDS